MQWRNLPYKSKLKLYERLKQQGNNSNPYSKYENDYLGFCKNELNETFYPDTEELIRSVQDNKITVAISATSTGKTHVAARLAACFYKVHQGRVYTGAAPPIENLKMLLWGELSKVYHSNDDLFKDDQFTNLHISEPGIDGPFIQGLTIPTTGGEHQREAKFSGKHYKFQLFVIDEGDAVPPEVYRGIEGCLSGGMGRLLIMFNPRDESGYVYDLIESGKANVVHLTAFNHPNVITGEDIFPGAVTRERTVERINEYCRLLNKSETPDNKCFELPDFLVGATAEKKKGVMYPPLEAGYYMVQVSAFWYMVLGQYPAAGEDQLIEKEWITRARLRWDLYVSKFGEIPPKGVRPIMGQDVAEFGADSNVSCFRYGGYVVFPARWSGVDPIVTGNRAAIEYKKRNAEKCNVDSTGVGASVAPTMKNKGCNSIRCMVASKPTYKVDLGEFALLNDQLAWEVREWLRTDDTAMLPPEDKLLKELRILTYKISKKGEIQVLNKDEQKKLLGRSPDDFDALKLTFAPEEPKARISFIS